MARDRIPADKMLRRRHPVDGGQLKPMAFADGYVMARRPGRMPFVMSEKEWQKLPEFEKE